MKQTNKIPYIDLESQLQPYNADRLLYRDIGRKANLVGRIAEGAKYTDVVTISYSANVSAGTFATNITISQDTSPLVMVWFLGQIDKTGAILDITDSGPCILTSNQSTYIFSGATASVVWDKDTITITIVSTNVGWASEIDAYFYYAVYYDETSSIVSDAGL